REFSKSRQRRRRAVRIACRAKTDWPLFRCRPFHAAGRDAEIDRADRKWRDRHRAWVSSTGSRTDRHSSAVAPRAGWARVQLAGTCRDWAAVLGYAMRVQGV